MNPKIAEQRRFRTVRKYQVGLVDLYGLIIPRVDANKDRDCVGHVFIAQHSAQ